MKQEVESLWGGSRRWVSYETSYRYAQAVPYRAAMRGVEALYLEGEKTTPAPAAVLAKARSYIEAAADPDTIRRYCDNNGHQWGIVDEQDGIRTLMCGRCRHTDTRPAHLAPTQSEIEDGVFTGRGDSSDDLTERIAP